MVGPFDRFVPKSAEDAESLQQGYFSGHICLNFYCVFPSHRFDRVGYHNGFLTGLIGTD